MSSVALQTSSSPAGRTILRPLALRRVAQAVVGELMGVSPSEVTIALGDARGLLSIDATAPLDLYAARASGTLAERAAAVTAALSDRFSSAAGRAVGRVRLRVTGIVGDQDARRVE